MGFGFNGETSRALTILIPRELRARAFTFYFFIFFYSFPALCKPLFYKTL